MTSKPIVSKKVHTGDNMFYEVSVEYANGSVVSLEYECYQQSFRVRNVEAFLHIYPDRVEASEDFTGFIKSRNECQLELMSRAFLPFIPHLPETMQQIIKKYNRNKVII